MYSVSSVHAVWDFWPECGNKNDGVRTEWKSDRGYAGDEGKSYRDTEGRDK